MREFKFRCYYKADNTMLEVCEINFTGNKITPTCLFWSPELGLYEAPIEFERDFELMQLTGLYDKHGKEIYDGDIVKFWVDGYAKSRTAKVKFNTERGRWMLFASVGHHRDLTAEKASKCEIIGNIYETPELLGGENE